MVVGYLTSMIQEWRLNFCSSRWENLQDGVYMGVEFWIQ